MTGFISDFCFFLRLGDVLNTVSKVEIMLLYPRKKNRQKLFTAVRPGYFCIEFLYSAWKFAGKKYWKHRNSRRLAHMFFTGSRCCIEWFLWFPSVARKIEILRSYKVFTFSISRSLVLKLLWWVGRWPNFHHMWDWVTECLSSSKVSHFNQLGVNIRKMSATCNFFRYICQLLQNLKKNMYVTKAQDKD